MFQRDYTLLDAAVVCRTLQTTACFKYEVKDMYPYLKRRIEEAGWQYYRVDTVDQSGFPDILVTRKAEYWLIEVKILRKSRLIDLKEDLTWQFGQIGFMRKALLRNTNYLLAVGAGPTLAYIKGATNDKQSINYPDFTGLI